MDSKYAGFNRLLVFESCFLPYRSYFCGRMQRIIPFLLFSVFLALGCRSGKRNIPDVSQVAVNLQVIRFEKDFFAVDTLHIDRSIQALHQKYPGFTLDFLYNILGSSRDSADRDVRLFIRSYKSLYDSSLLIMKDFPAVVAAVKKGLQFVHYYFPAYHLPAKLITFIGPINSFGNVITPDALAVGLQLYMGKNYSLYLTDMGQQLYPGFVSRRFEPAYIPVNCMRNIVDDMYPDKSQGRPLIEQIVESGKRMYLLDQILPELADTLKTGYTADQLKGCYANEKNIWSFFVQNELLFKTDPNLTRDYLNDAPNTPELGDNSPGNIGLFIGWRIVQKWMEANPGTSLDAMMKKNPAHLFEESRYKPK